MSRYGLVLALFFVAAEGACIPDCALVCDSNEASAAAYVGAGEKNRVIYTRYCTTCGHSTITVSAQFPPDSGGGNLEFFIGYKCGSLSGTWHESTVAGHNPDYKYVFKDVNVKSPCQEVETQAVPVNYTVYVSAHNTSVSIPVQASILCPQALGNSSGPTRPGAVR